MLTCHIEKYNYLRLHFLLNCATIFRNEDGFFMMDPDVHSSNKYQLVLNLFGAGTILLFI